MPGDKRTHLPLIIYLDNLTRDQKVRINGINAGDAFGSASCSAGTTGKFGNFMVCSPYNNYLGAGGSCYYTKGNTTIGFNGVLEASSFDGRNGIAMHGNAGDGLAYSCGNLGDLKKDGFPLVGMGSTAASPGGLTFAGAVYMFAPGKLVNSNGHFFVSTINETTGCIQNGIQAGDSIGYSVAGDVTDTGEPFFVSGAASASRLGKTNVGVFNVKYGSSSFCPGGVLPFGNNNSTIGFTGIGISAGDFTATTVLPMNSGNGAKSIAISAASASPNGLSGAGRVYNVPLSVGTNVTVDMPKLNNTQFGMVNGYEINAFFSARIVRGDFDGNGQLDLAAGSTGASPNGFQSGQTDVLLDFSQTGFTELSSNNSFRLTGAPAGARSGFVTAVNFDGDLADDVVTAGPYQDKVWLFRGGSHIQPNGTADISKLSSTTCSQFVGAAGSFTGGTVTRVRDGNGDGVQDLLICSYNGSPGGRTGAGYCDLVFGDVSPNINFNQFTIADCATAVPYNRSHLNVTDVNHASGTFIYYPNITNGFVHLAGSTQPLFNFSGSANNNLGFGLSSGCSDRKWAQEQSGLHARQTLMLKIKKEIRLIGATLTLGNEAKPIPARLHGIKTHFYEYNFGTQDLSFMLDITEERIFSPNQNPKLLLALKDLFKQAILQGNLAPELQNDQTRWLQQNSAAMAPPIFLEKLNAYLTSKKVIEFACVVMKNLNLKNNDCGNYQEWLTLLSQLLNLNIRVWEMQLEVLVLTFSTPSIPNANLNQDEDNLAPNTPHSLHVPQVELRYTPKNPYPWSLLYSQPGLIHADKLLGQSLQNFDVFEQTSVEFSPTAPAEKTGIMALAGGSYRAQNKSQTVNSLVSSNVSIQAKQTSGITCDDRKAFSEKQASEIGIGLMVPVGNPIFMARSLKEMAANAPQMFVDNSSDKAADNVKANPKARKL